MPNLFLFILDAALYFVMASIFWPGGRYCCRPSAQHRLWALLPLVLHLALLQASLLPAGGGISLGFSTSLSAMAALTVMFYAAAAWLYPIGGLQGFVLAFAGVAVGLQGLMPAANPVAHGVEPLFALHLLMAFAAYGFFAIATLHAILMALAEKHLHRPVPPKLVADLPPLLTLETLLFRMLEVGFVILTLTLVTGGLFAEALFGRPLPMNHMTVFGLISWLIYFGLMMGRRIYGWRGRKAIYGALAGFASLMLAYFGVAFVLEVILRRA